MGVGGVALGSFTTAGFGIFVAEGIGAIFTKT